MATTDELIKQLRDRAKSGKRGSKTAAKAFVKDAKPLTAELCGIEVKCPKCGSDNYVKDGEGRFKCKDCGKKFRSASGSLLSGYDFTFDEWLKIIDCVLSGRENSKFTGAVKYSMSAKKAWLLRMKILSSFSRMPQPVLSGIVQVDGTYFRESQKGSRSLKSFAGENYIRNPRYTHEPSVTGAKGQKFVCCVTGIDNSGHVFAKCMSYGMPDYDDFVKLLDQQIQTPLYISSDNLDYYERYCDEKCYQHYIEPSTFKNEKLFYGFVVQNDKYHPLPLTDKELKNNQKVLETMYYERSGPHIRNAGNMTYDAFKQIVDGLGQKYFGLERVNQFHGDLKTLVNTSGCVSSQYLQGYVSMMAYIRNFKVDNGHIIGTDLNDYEVVFKDILKYYDYDYFKNEFMADKRNIELRGRLNHEKEKAIKKATSLYSINKDAFDSNSVQEMPDIFNKRRCFREMKPHRINYLCDYFKIDTNIPKTKKCDALANLPNADEIIFREIKLLYFAEEDEVLEAIKDGFLENPDKKRVGRPKGIKKNLTLTDEELNRLKGLKKAVFDIETTGLDKNNDEILSLSIIDGDGNVLFDKLFKPLHRKKWTRAAQVNNITYDQVDKEKPFSFCKDKIQKIFDEAELLIAYNNPFDVSFLEVNGIDLADKEQFDVMAKFGEILKDGRKHKLSYCADWYRFNWQEDQHTSLGDVKATLYCFNEMVK